MTLGMPEPPERHPDRRRDEREARVDWILDAALELVLAEGVAALTTTKLAKKLGYTHAAFYRYFESKDALLLALETRTAERYYARFFELYDEQRSELARLADTAGRDIASLAQIALLARLYATLARERPKHFRLVGVLLAGDRSWMKGEGGKRLQAFVGEQIAHVVGLFLEAEASHALEPGRAPERLMTLWFSMHAVLSAAPLAEAHPELIAIESMAEGLVRALLRGWGAIPTKVDEAVRLAAGADHEHANAGPMVPDRLTR